MAAAAAILLPACSGVATIDLKATETFHARATQLLGTANAMLAASAYPTAATLALPTRFPTNTPTLAAVPSPSGTTPALPTTTPTTTAEPTVIHKEFPSAPGVSIRYLTDPSSQDYAPQQRAPSGSDEFQQNRFERPFTAGSMDYLPEVDIVRAELSVLPPWIYITLRVAGGRPAAAGNTAYGVELDVNRDNRGDFLIWGLLPAGGDWTTEGVEIRQDVDGDVGGARPQISDPPPDLGNGYETVLFSSGRGSDPDWAWIRRVGDGSVIQIAFQPIAIGNPPAFFWSVFADHGVKRADWFDYNDRFTQAEAGSPLPVQTGLYPLKQLFGVDNTYRDAYGFSPNGLGLNLCQ